MQKRFDSRELASIAAPIAAALAQIWIPKSKDFTPELASKVGIAGAIIAAAVLTAAAEGSKAP